MTWETTIRAYNIDGELETFEGPKINALTRELAQIFCECFHPYCQVVGRTDNTKEIMREIKMN